MFLQFFGKLLCAIDTWPLLLLVPRAIEYRLLKMAQHGDKGTNTRIFSSNLSSLASSVLPSQGLSWVQKQTGSTELTPSAPAKTDWKGRQRNFFQQRNFHG